VSRAPRRLLPGHRDAEAFVGIDEVVVVVLARSICTQWIFPVNLLVSTV